MKVSQKEGGPSVVGFEAAHESERRMLSRQSLLIVHLRVYRHQPCLRVLAFLNKTTTGRLACMEARSTLPGILERLPFLLSLHLPSASCLLLCHAHTTALTTTTTTTIEDRSTFSLSLVRCTTLRHTLLHQAARSRSHAGRRTQPASIALPHRDCARSNNPTHSPAQPWLL